MTDRHRLLRAAAALAVLLLLGLSGCAVWTRNELYQDADRAFRSGNYTLAKKILEDNRTALYGKNSQLLYNLELGMLSWYEGSWSEAVRYLDRAEELIEQYYTQSIRQAAASFLINDLQLDYSGEPFEDIYLNVFKALSYLELGNRDAALVEVRRIETKLNLLEDRYGNLAAAYSGVEGVSQIAVEPGTIRFHNSALARYLSLVLYRLERDFDEVRIDWKQLQNAFSGQPNIYRFSLPLTEAAAEPTRNGRLCVAAFTGQAPIKQAQTLWIRTEPDILIIASASEVQNYGRVIDRYTVLPFPGIEPDLQFKVEVPKMAPLDSQAAYAVITADGVPLGRLGLLEDMQTVAMETFALKEPLIMIRSVIRSVLKGSASYSVRSALEEQEAETESGGLELLSFIGRKIIEIGTDLSEQADLRVSRYFPAFAHVGEWILPPGTYEIEAVYYTAQGRALYTDDLGPVELFSGDSVLCTTSYSR